MAGSSCQNSLNCASGLKVPTAVMAKSSASCKVAGPERSREYTASDVATDLACLPSMAQVSLSNEAFVAQDRAVAFRECDDTAEEPSSEDISRKCLKIEVTSLLDTGRLHAKMQSSGKRVA